MPVVIKHNTTGMLFKYLVGTFGAGKHVRRYEWTDDVEDASTFHVAEVAEFVLDKFNLNAQLEHIAKR